MDKDHKKKNPFQTSSRSRKRTPRQKAWLALPLALLVLLIAGALFFTVKHAIGKWGGGDKKETTTVAATTTAPAYMTAAWTTTAAQTTPVQTTPTQTSPGQTQTTPAASSEAAGSSTVSTEPLASTPAVTAPVTTAPPETTTAANPGADTGYHLYTAAEVLPVPEGISRNFFDDINASDAGGSWWFGKRTRNLETGEVEKGYDRSAATLALIDKYHAIYRKNEDQKVTYLTFDCGYEYGFTGSILDTLRDKNVKAVFFIAGDFVNDAKNKELLQRMYNEGHIIGSHTDHHPVMPTKSDEEFIDELNNLQIKVNNMLGLEYQIRFYRPPQGSSSERDLYLAEKMGLTTVFWSYAYGDYDTQNQMEVSQALEKAKVGLHDGSVYLLHAVSSTNAAMLGDLIDYIRGEGYEIRRIDQ